MSQPYKLKSYVNLTYSFASADAFVKSSGAASNLVSHVIPALSITPSSSPDPSPCNLSIAFYKFTSNERILLDQCFTLSFLVVNVSTDMLYNLTLFDALYPHLYFLEGSVQVNGTVIPCKNPGQGIYLDHLASGQFLLVSFSAQFQLIPADLVISNEAMLSYQTYSDDKGWLSKEIKSNIVQLQVDYYRLSFSYHVSPCQLTPRTFIFSLRIVNRSTLPLTEAKLFLCHSSYVYIMPDTVTINDFPYPLTQSKFIPLNDLPVNYCYEIAYTAYTTRPELGTPSVSVYLEHSGGITYPDQIE